MVCNKLLTRHKIRLLTWVKVKHCTCEGLGGKMLELMNTLGVINENTGTLMLLKFAG